MSLAAIKHVTCRDKQKNRKTLLAAINNITCAIRNVTCRDKKRKTLLAAIKNKEKIKKKHKKHYLPRRKP